MSEANASEGETVASKLLQKYFIAILKPQLVKTCSTAFCRLAAGGSVDFFMIVVCLSVFLSAPLTGSCSLLFVLRPWIQKRCININAPHARSSTMFLRFSRIFVGLPVSCVYDCPVCGYWGFSFAHHRILCVHTFSNYRLICATEKIPVGTF